MTVAPLLDVRDLKISFGNGTNAVPVVSNLSFQVNAGETLAIVGESGSGKSVSAMSLIGLLPKTGTQISGSAIFGDRDLFKMSNADLRQVRGSEISMIFQEPMTSLNPVLPIGAQIAEALCLHRSLDKRSGLAEARRMLDRVRIPSAAERMNDFPHRFSGGMRQRVMIAMALACRPRLLIADEPTTALDVTIQDQILALLRMLREEEGMTILFITHDMGVVAEIADRTLVMKGGKSVEENATAALFAEPRYDYTRHLLASVPRLGSATGVPAIVTTDPPAPPVLSVRDLKVHFDQRGGLLGRLKGRLHAVDGLSFDIAPGETLALVGESGCGKSTTGKAIMRFIEPKSGQILLDGTDMAAMTPNDLRAARRQVQMVFQDPYGSLNPRLTVGRAIAEPLLVHGLVSSREAARNKVASLLDLVGLNAAMTDRYPHEFSGGQRQRLSIARALALSPKLLIADEAVSALDVSVKAQIVELLRELQDELGIALLFISHDIAVVEQISHRVAVMRQGQIVEMGMRDQVLKTPAHPYTKKLLASVPIPDPANKRPPVSLSNDEILSQLRPLDFVSPVPRYRELSPHHQVRIED